MILSAVLKAREERWERKCALSRSTAGCVVSLTLRLHADMRVSETGRRYFEYARTKAEEFFKKSGITLTCRMNAFGDDGPYCLWTGECNAENIKRIAMAFEEEEEAGVFTDLDVMLPSGRELSRSELGGKDRKCFVCGNADARECILEKRHTASETAECARMRIFEIMKG